jgi:hypothetical protein
MVQAYPTLFQAGRLAPPTPASPAPAVRERRTEGLFNA